MQIKNIVLDFGGILTGLDKDRCVRALRRVGAGRIAYYVDECKQENLFHSLEIGESSVGEFCEEARRQCSYTDEMGVFHQCETTDEELVWAWNELLLGVPEEKLRYVKRLHDLGRYNVMLLSNTNVVHWERAVREFFTHADGMEYLCPEDFFHRIFLSCDMNMIKPDACIFERMLAESGCKAEETIFIDDSLKNCNGANAVGIATIFDPEYDTWMARLDALLGENLSGEVFNDACGKADETAKIRKKTYYAATIGTFDGVHLGHRHVIKRLHDVIEKERCNFEDGELESMVMTFDRHPRSLFDADYSPMTLTTLEDRRRLLRGLGVNKCEVLRFDKAFANTSARDFMQELYDHYNVRVLLVGYDNHFGKRKQGEGFADYQKYGDEIGIKVVGCDEFLLSDGSPVSSSVIRKLFENGETELAEQLLGRAPLA